MKKETRQNPSSKLVTRLRSFLLLTVISVASALAVGELYVRFSALRNIDGEWSLAGIRLPPRQLPTEVTRAAIEQYLHTEKPYVRFDERLGWSPNPDSASRDGTIRYNSQGIRSPIPSIPLTPTPGKLRIAIFGDSYTHCDDVTFENSWGARLEQDLFSQGVSAEVINFGTGGYGMDQALLRYEQQGQFFNPDMVLFGFQAENVKRNLNLMRTIAYNPRDIPFSKPRFVLKNSALELINSPVVPINGIVATVEHFPAWPLHSYEVAYRPNDYARTPWRWSKLLAFMEVLLEEDPASEDARFFAPGSEGFSLAEAIIQRFKRSVEINGTQFFTLHLPILPYLIGKQGSGSLPYQALLESLKASTYQIDLQPVVEEALATKPANELFIGHYSPILNEAIANQIAATLSKSLTQNPPPRLVPKI